MLIICPDCESSYDVDEADIGPAGRKVRCTECGAVWLARQAESSASPAPEESPEEIAEPEILPAVVTEEETEAHLRDEDLAAPAPIEAIISNPALQQAKEASTRRRRPRGTAPRAPMSRRALGLAAVAGVVLVVAFGFGRNTLVGLVPDLAGLYEMVGLPINLRGLEFDGVSTVEKVEAGVPQLAVRGTIRNVSEEQVAVPRLRLAVRDKSGREIFVWTAMPSRSELNPGEKLPFFAQIASPPAAGREVTVRFVGARDAVQTAAR